MNQGWWGRPGGFGRRSSRCAASDPFRGPFGPRPGWGRPPDPPWRSGGGYDPGYCSPGHSPPAVNHGLRRFSGQQHHQQLHNRPNHHHQQQQQHYQHHQRNNYRHHQQQKQQHHGAGELSSSPGWRPTTTFYYSSSLGGAGGVVDEVGSNSSESEPRSSSEQGDLTPDGSGAELAQVIPRIIKPRKRRKKEKKPKIPRMSAGGSGGVGRTAAGEERRDVVRRLPSVGYESQSSSSEGHLPGTVAWMYDGLCSEVADLRLGSPRGGAGRRLQLSPSAESFVGGAGALRRCRSDPCHRADASTGASSSVSYSPHLQQLRRSEDQPCYSCPASLEFPLSAASQLFPPPVNVPQPPQRPWIPLGRPSSTRPTCIFTVMCYNVLCEKYATRQMYGYCPNWALEWDYRKKYIMQEIRNCSADIITLQEVQTDQFYGFFLPQLQRDRYEGIFSPKSRAKTMQESERKYVDGCAIFWRTDKFTLVKEHLIEFNQLAMANAEGSDDMLNRVMTKDNIGLAAMLETRDSAWENTSAPSISNSGDSGQAAAPSHLHQRLLVCTAHIHWDPEFCDVKLIQTMMLINEIRQIMESAGREMPSMRPGGGQRPGTQLLLCGDLNSLPDSGVVQFLVDGHVPADHGDFKELGYRTSLKKLSGAVERGGEYTHPFRLASSYGPGVMPFTNFTYDFKGIIDYIFYSRDTMTPLGVLGPLDAHWLHENKVQGCPHPHIPSDHFSLLVELEMTPSSCQFMGPVANGLMHR